MAERKTKSFLLLGWCGTLREPGNWELAPPIGLNDKADNYRIITQLIYEFDVL